MFPLLFIIVLAKHNSFCKKLLTFLNCGLFYYSSTKYLDYAKYAKTTALFIHGYTVQYLQFK